MTKGTHHTKSDAIYEALRRMIIEGDLPAGAAIEEPVMMERLEVGRTPLREALQRLAEDELVRRRPNRGYFVGEISPSDLLHIFEIREQLEILCARKGAERARPQDIAEYAAWLAEAKEGVAAGRLDRSWNLKMDERFHDILARASGNAYLPGATQRYFNLSVRILYLSHMDMALIRDEMPNYDSMLSALERHDPAAAEAIMRSHMAFDPATVLKAFSRRISA